MPGPVVAYLPGRVGEIRFLASLAGTAGGAPLSVIKPQPEWRTTMAERSSWGEIRARRMTEPGADTAYHAAKLAYELGRIVRQLREQRGLSQTQLAVEANMTQSAVAGFEAGGTVPSLPVLDRLARGPRRCPDRAPKVRCLPGSMFPPVGIFVGSRQYRGQGLVLWCGGAGAAKMIDRRLVPQAFARGGEPDRGGPLVSIR